MIRAVALLACGIEVISIILALIFPERLAEAPLWLPDLLLRAFFATFTGTLSGLLCWLQGDVFAACTVFRQERPLLIGVLVSVVTLTLLKNYQPIFHALLVLTGAIGSLIHKIVYAYYYIFTPHPATNVVKRSKGGVSDHIALVNSISSSLMKDIAKGTSAIRQRVLRRKAEANTEYVRRTEAEEKLAEEHLGYVRRKHRRKREEADVNR